MLRRMFQSGRWVLALTLVVVLSYWKIVFTKQFTILWLWEMVSQYYAWCTYAATYIRKGVVPLWDPFRYGGVSFNGEMQAGFFYPFKLALYLAPFDRNGLLSERAFNEFYVFSHWLAAFLMFVLVRYLKLGNLAALAAGICFGLGGFVQWTAWLNLLDAMPWLPLVVLFVLRTFESGRLVRQFTNACAAGLALGMTFLAGGLHIAMMDILVAASLTAYLWLSKRENRSIFWVAAVLGAIVLTSVLFGAVQHEVLCRAAQDAIRQDGAVRGVREIWATCRYILECRWRQDGEECGVILQDKLGIDAGSAAIEIEIDVLGAGRG